jgi:hypothetical protein
MLIFNSTRDIKKLTMRGVVRQKTARVGLEDKRRPVSDGERL